MPSTIAGKIAVHFAAPPQSNPNISRFAQIAVVFWADSNCDLPVPFAGHFWTKARRLKPGMPLRCVVMGSITMETTAYRPSKGSRAFDSDRAASHPSTASFIRARAERADLSQDDPIPLFLSDPLGAPDPREYAPLTLHRRTRTVPRVLAAVLAVSAAAVLATLFQPDLRSLFDANAGRRDEHQLRTRPAAQVSAPAVQQVPLKDPARVTNTRLASADTQDLAAPSAPSREAIATAYQIALQAQAPVPVAAQPAPPAPPQPAKTLDADTLAGLMTRAKSLFGDRRHRGSAPAARTRGQCPGCDGGTPAGANL